MSKAISFDDYEVEYLLWSLWQNVNEIEDSPYFDEDSANDVQFILSLVESIEIQYYGKRVETDYVPRTVEED